METIQTPDRIQSLRELAAASPLGVAAEVGVFQGGTLIQIAEAIPDRMLIGFDTFSGLPRSKRTSIDELIRDGSFGETSLEQVARDLQDHQNVILVPGTFPESATEEHKIVPYSFVHIDNDYYLCVLEALQFFWPRMVSGGVIVLDDFRSEHARGVDKAIYELGLQPIPTVEWQCKLIHP